MSTATNADIQILRDLAKQYMEIVNDPKQEERRVLWEKHFALKTTRPPVLCRFGMWNVWCKEIFGDDQMQCQDPFYRQYEREMRIALFHDSINDDCIAEPYLGVRAAVYMHPEGYWGLNEGRHHSGDAGGAYKMEAPIEEIEDWVKMVEPHHEIDETKTKQDFQKISEAIGDIVPIFVNRAPALTGFHADISTHLAALRGLEEVMMDMVEDPEELHKMLAFMRDGTLKQQQEAEDAGDYSLVNHYNQAIAYCEGLERPEIDNYGVKRSQLWCFCAAQEFTGVGPDMHDQFLLQYQQPIIEKYAMSHYGCCEDLTLKIDMLRKIKNLRSIAVTPTANVGKCAEQIGADYAMSYRPNPTDMVCYGYDEAKIRRILGDAFQKMREGHYHVFLKDVETVEGDTDRLRRWVALVREILDEMKG